MTTAVVKGDTKIMPPFIILALPRSRTTWLSRFLTYGDWACWHEQARYVRSPSDVATWFAQDHTGTVETAVSRWWKLIRLLRPDVRIVLVRRPVDEVVESLMRLDLGEVGRFDRDRLMLGMTKLDHSLDRITKIISPLSVRYQDLECENSCAAVFEHCLGIPHDPAWWRSLSGVNVQTDMRALMRYARTFDAQMNGAARVCTSYFRNANRLRARNILRQDDDGVVIQEEPLAMFWSDGQELFREHCKIVGEPEDQFLRKNLPLINHLEAMRSWQFVTARQDGKMLGYLASIVVPSIEREGLITATQNLLFVSPSAGKANLSLRLQRASIAALEKRGIGEIHMRAGIRGSGDRLGILYRRLGAKPFGELYKLVLERGN